LICREISRHFRDLSISKWQNSCSRTGIRFRYLIFEISSMPSFVEAVLWRVTQFFYLLCSQFRQKASGWINKTLLLIKQQKWNTNIFLFGLIMFDMPRNIKTFSWFVNIKMTAGGYLLQAFLKNTLFSKHQKWHLHNYE
jgi:hypothetical protein